jgi:hypothetical protein
MSRYGEDVAITISVTVKPNAKKPVVTRISPTEYRASISAAPVDGKANQALVALLADHFGVAKSLVAILRGHGAKKKLIRIG